MQAFPPVALVFWGERMTEQYIRAYRAEDGEQPESGPIRFVAATEEVGRDGMVIDSGGWQLDNYRANPVVLWAHDYLGQHPPIGRAEVEVKTRKLYADITFDAEDPFAAGIERKYRSGFLNAVSVGWNSLQFEPGDGGNGPLRVTKAELLDISAVPVPGDPNALKERQLRGLHDIGETLARLSDPDPNPEAQPSEFVWPGVAVAMARLYLDTSDDDGEREQRFRRLSREYRALGKEPPEWMTRSQLSLLGEEEIRGLFLADEGVLLGWKPDGERKGAVLSSRNFGDLEQAIHLVRGVLERATKEEPTQEDAERAFLAQFAKSKPNVVDMLQRLAG